MGWWVGWWGGGGMTWHMGGGVHRWGGGGWEIGRYQIQVGCLDGMK